MTHATVPGPAIDLSGAIDPHIQLSRLSSQTSRTETPGAKVALHPTCPDTSEVSEPVSVAPPAMRKSLEKSYFVSMCLCLFLAGWNELVSSGSSDL